METNYCFLLSSMGSTLSLGEINYRIYLTVTEINNHVDVELSLEDLKADLKTLRKIRQAYSEAIKAFEEEAHAFRARCVTLINELNDSTTFTNDERRSWKRRSGKQFHPDIVSGGLTAENALRMGGKLPVLSPPEPVIPKVRFPDKGYLYKLKCGWRKRQLHMHGSSHSTLAHGEAHLEQVSRILVAKRQASYNVQRAIRATKENIKLEKEAIEELNTILQSPPRYIYEDVYNRYCELLHIKAETPGLSGRVKPAMLEKLISESSGFNSVTSHSATASICSR